MQPPSGRNRAQGNCGQKGRVAVRTVRVAAGKPYDVLIDRGLLAAAGDILKDTLKKTCKAAILTDDTVDALYGAQTEYAL